jgi:hypothetical protein
VSGTVTETTDSGDEAPGVGQYRIGVRRQLVVTAVATWLGAYLLFWVQPLLSKAILPWFGGTPAVWTTCLLFFQVGLLVGYGYAVLLSYLARTWSPYVVPLIHAALWLLALLSLPLLPAAEWKPTADSSTEPTWHILWLLLLHVGPAYIMLASTAPLLQAWYAQTGGRGRPYRFYALSNAGSLMALLGYPFILEAWLTVSDQAWWWGSLLAIQACLSVYLGWQTFLGGSFRGGAAWRERVAKALSGLSPSSSAERPTWRLVAAWILLPALGSATLMAVTSHICQDIAVVPFLWIAPLALYLVSFIVCFDHPGWYWRRTWAVLAVITIFALGWAKLEADQVPLVLWLGIRTGLGESLQLLKVEIVWHLAALFMICMLCHGELARRQPHPRWLTQYYLALATGGALGGLSVAVVAPLVFVAYHELPITLAGGSLLALAIVSQTLLPGRLADSLAIWRRRPSVLAAWVSVPVILTAIFWNQAQPAGVVFQGRSFFGVLAVKDRSGREERAGQRIFVHGRILHGAQWRDPDRQLEPSTYYGPPSGVGQLFALTADRAQGRRVVVVGLGAGCLAAFSQPQDWFRFYEINPLVVDVAKQYFTFLDLAAGQVEIELADGRLGLEQSDALELDLLILDAFSGDAVPVHLLTQEALQHYARHIRSGGVIAFHISNRHLNLQPVLADLAEQAGWQAILISPPRDQLQAGMTQSDWVLLQRPRSTAFADLPAATVADEAAPLPALSESLWQHVQPLEKRSIPLWTDDFTSLWHVLR